jgi:hypothetical protein
MQLLTKDKTPQCDVEEETLKKIKSQMEGRRTDQQRISRIKI